MRALLLLLLLQLWPSLLLAQSRLVDPDDLRLSVEVIDQQHTPYTREMIMIVVRGVYRRHITREELEQPDFKGFNWTQLGPDSWRDDRIRGQKVKVLERRMALYPEQAGTLTIGAFTHHLTLTDEDDNWFAHDIRSQPVTVDVAPRPQTAQDDWWFPVRRLEIADSWSNAPDQLKAGEGVLRIVRLEALGVTPEMIPPMPELTSPSAMIFAHPEKRLVELSPAGPVTHAFWRWTIRPTNDRSTIVEPLRFSYFDTTTREMKSVEITAQRVAYDNATLAAIPPPSAPARLPGWPAALVGALVLLAAVVWIGRGRHADFGALQRRFPMLDPEARALRRAARSGDAPGVRRAARALIMRSGRNMHLLDRFDRAMFARHTRPLDLPDFARAVLKAQRD